MFGDEFPMTLRVNFISNELSHGVFYCILEIGLKTELEMVICVNESYACIMAEEFGNTGGFSSA